MNDALKGLRVVVCEDEALIRLNIVDVLELAGCSVVEAGNGGQALEHIDATGGADLLLTDLGLPDMNGLDLARRAVETVPDLAVLFATGDSAVEGAEALPRSAVLSKPFSDEMLLKSVRDLLAG